MSAVPERDAVDRCLKSARDALPGLTGSANTAAQIACDLTEALVRQIRDADDTQANSVAHEIATGLSDLNIVVSQFPSSMAKELADRLDLKKRGGLF